jgi:protein required for attachment to host cells
MSKQIPEDALIVVADGGKALLLRNVGARGELVLNEERKLTLKDFADDLQAQAWRNNHRAKRVRRRLPSSSPRRSIRCSIKIYLKRWF